MRNQNELKEAMKEILITQVWPKSPDMVAYCMKKAAYMVELENGDFMEIDKPTIETSFCFGYGLNGVSTEEEYRGAAAMMDYASKEESYFLEQNLRGINGMIEQLDGNELKAYKRIHYIGQKDGSHLMSIEFCHYWQGPEKGWTELTKEERQAIADGYKVVREQFIKRLKTYLKRYGTSKLKTWTYLVD